MDSTKKHFNRPRPYLRDTQIHACANPEESTAYPSGHAAFSLWIAKVLAYLEPDKAKLFLQRADEAALLRVKGGVHHPSDIAAGKIIGEKIFADLMKNKEFKKELDQLKKEFYTMPFM